MNDRESNRLLKNLLDESRMQQKLLVLLTKERACIVTLQNEELDKIVASKNALLQQINENREQREVLFAVVLNEGTPQARKGLKLSDLVNGLKESSVKEELSSVLDSLRHTVETVHELNGKNSSLLKQSLGIVSSAVSIIRAKPSTPDNASYSNKGKMNNAEENLGQLAPVSSFSKSA